MTDPFNAFCTHVTMQIPGAPAGPLAGLRFAAKDNFAVAGHQACAGNPDWLRTHAPAEHTAPAVQTLLDAGATLVGKTQLDELAFSLAGQNAHYGTPINPRAPDRIPGGSSSGSAAATAGGLVDFALGTDTAGSVRVPSHNCGIYGARPTHGQFSLDGVVPFSPSFDTVGWFARDADLLRRVGLVLLSSASPLAAPGRLLVAEEVFALADKEVREALQPLIPIVSEVVGPVEHLPLSTHKLDLWVEQFHILRGREVWASLGAWVEAVRPQLGPGIRERFEQTRGVTEEQATAARAARRVTQSYLDGLLQPGAVLCLPTAPLLAPLRSSSEAVLAHYRSQTLKLTTIAGIGGLPQVSLPVAAVGRCPVGLSLIGGRGQDARLWDLAVEIEKKMGLTALSCRAAHGASLRAE
jgi:amidase